jgi:hypothetical protein
MVCVIIEAASNDENRNVQNAIRRICLTMDFFFIEGRYRRIELGKETNIINN